LHRANNTQQSAPQAHLEACHLSLLSICQNVAGEAGFGIPGTIVGNSDDTAVLLLKLVNRAGGLLARKPWQMLQKEYTFSLVNGTDNYAFPTDYGFFQDYTAWDRNQFWALRGGLEQHRLAGVEVWPSEHDSPTALQDLEGALLYPSGSGQHGLNGHRVCL
jgi:hypothetical protein